MALDANRCDLRNATRACIPYASTARARLPSKASLTHIKCQADDTRQEDQPVRRLRLNRIPDRKLFAEILLTSPRPLRIAVKQATLTKGSTTKSARNSFWSWARIKYGCDMPSLKNFRVHCRTSQNNTTSRHKTNQSSILSG